MLPDLPRADHIARAIVTAGRAMNEDPLEVCAGRPGMRSRYYAFAALHRLFPWMKRISLARCLGVLPARRAKFCWNVKRGATRPWWRGAVLDETIEAVRAMEPGPEADEAGEAIDLPAIKLTPPAIVQAARPKSIIPAVAAANRPIRSALVTSELMGDPMPGRSALAQRVSAYQSKKG